MAKPINLKMDSPEGMRYLMEWARAHKFVLHQWHCNLAKKHGVSTEGVLFVNAELGE